MPQPRQLPPAEPRVETGAVRFRKKRGLFVTRWDCQMLVPAVWMAICECKGSHTRQQLQRLHNLLREAAQRGDGE